MSEAYMVSCSQVSVLSLHASDSYVLLYRHYSDFDPVRVSKLSFIAVIGNISDLIHLLL